MHLALSALMQNKPGILRAIHKAVRHHHCHDAAGTQRVPRTGKEVIVNAEA